MKTRILQRNAVYQGNLRLVNAQYPCREGERARYFPPDARFPGVRLAPAAGRALRAVWKHILSGDAIVPVSGYRTMAEQTEIYEQSLKENGERFTRQYVALPGRSEHQTGLAIDLGLNREPIDFIRPDFPYDGICEDFRRAAPDFGFIERYAKEKERITGISHEPWHFRYVGQPHARIMTERGLSLEEYITLLQNYRADCRLFCPISRDCAAEIYYVPAEREANTIRLPEGCACQISGNNVDGFIVTVWRARHEAAV